MAALFEQFLLLQRRSLTARVRQQTRVPKKVRWLYPWAAERRYYQQLYKWTLPFVQAIEAYISQQAESILHGDEYRPIISNPKLTSVTLHKDLISASLAYHGDVLPGPGFVALAKTLSGWVAQYYPDPETNRSPPGVLMGLGDTSTAVKVFCDKQWGNQTKPLLGIQFNSAESWWPTVKQQWQENNYKLIKSITSQYIERVNVLAEKAVINGWSYTTLMKDIKAEGVKLKTWQLRRLARDQVGKLNGQISQAQQQDAGIDWYWWETAGDERVRGNPRGKFPRAVPSHFIMDGLLCKWSDATVYSDDGGKTWKPRTDKMPKAHPGQEIQCRCTSIPYFEGIVNKVDQQIDGEGGAIQLSATPSIRRTIKEKKVGSNEAHLPQILKEVAGFEVGRNVSTALGRGVILAMAKNALSIQLNTGKVIKAYRSYSRGFGVYVYRYNDKIVRLI
jgi:hypothetical protein